MQGYFSDSTPTPQEGEEGAATYGMDPLQLEIEDSDLCRIVDAYSEDYQTFYKGTYNLFERRKRNELHLFGRQHADREKMHLYKDYESRFQDNVLYEIEGTIKPLAMSRIPDLMVTPGNNSDQSVLMAQEISTAIDTEVKEYENRFVLGLASKHFPVYFIAAIKAYWDPEIDDYRFINVHPDFIEIDRTSPTKNADEMKFVSHLLSETLQTIILKFPESKEKFLQALKDEGIYSKKFDQDGNPTWALLATEIKYKEVWFHEYIRHEDDEVERVDGVLWKYKDVILGKMKNPNHDYEGETRYFAYDKPGDESSKRALNQEELYHIMLTGELPGHVQEQKVYHNYFRRPRKPFYFMGYDQWGKQPMDETSRIEQNIQNQKSLDTRGKQIEQTLDSRGHHILAKSAVSPSELEEIDFDEPNIDLSVDGKPSEVYNYIPPERPTKEEFEEINSIRQRMYAIAHSSAVRGEIKSAAPATSNQIAREGDFTAADDLVEDTINNASQWMADWSMQFIKLRYTKDHMRWIMGIAGDMVWMKLNRNMIADGMLVKIKASGTDKLRAQNNAIEMAKMQMTDPYTFYKDMGLSDPEGRTERLILAKTDPVSYLQKVVKGLNTSQALADALARAQLPLQQNSAILPQVPGQQQQPMVGGAPAGGQSQNPSMQNTSQVPAAPPPGAPAGSPRAL